MNVRVEVQLVSTATEVHLEDMLLSAKALTNDERSISVYVSNEKTNSVVAEFTIHKARQMDVVDGIAREFRVFVRDYGHSTISSSKKVTKKACPSKNQYTHKQGQYLAFIYYSRMLRASSPPS